MRWWSSAAAFRAVRAMVVVPGLFALTYEVIGDLQMATFAAFGGFATLVLASFSGTRRDRALAHGGLAVAGSALLVLGTAVNASPWVAAAVTLPVTFLVLFAGIAGPNAAAGGTAALLAYVLPAASPGTIDMLGSRLAGWWLASVVGAAAVLLLSPRPPGDRLRAAVAASAGALADRLDAALRGAGTDADRAAALAAKHELLAAFTATPYRPTGSTVADQALTSLVGMLEWATAVLEDGLREYPDLRTLAPVERDLYAATRDTLRRVAALPSGGAEMPDLAGLQRAIGSSVAALRRMPAGDGDFADAVHQAFHAQTSALTVRAATLDALIAAGCSDPATAAEQARRWYGLPAARPPRAGVLALAWRHANLRSVWFRNSVRGAFALAAAVLVADLVGVQHAFWVVLGTLSVLRTNAAGTGSTAVRALLGTVVGFVVGAALLLVVGTGPGALWVALPIAVLVAGYAPGTLPFAAGQAAFTIVVSVLYNLLVPVGWSIGVVRIEDVALGCAVSLVVGVLFWPRGASAVVGDDVADAFREGGRYLAQSVDWALGLRQQEPEPARAVTAGLRLDEGVRGLLAERGTRHLATQQLWRLVGGTIRLRLTAQSLASLPSPDAGPDPVSDELSGQAARIARWFDDLADLLVRPGAAGPSPAPAVAIRIPTLRPVAAAAATDTLPCTLWVEQHLQHIRPALDSLVVPAAEVARLRGIPWWR
ncbi:FUSC family protein [Actinocatenispora thailandica]|uniref:FUSC family protein n=2 Tax=Actinocatenispora thailandica TaxID=227318 RepID=A0A7R7HVW2_9ACTN|nr:FUSC family protein [Actinocatenispora thailandica]